MLRVLDDDYVMEHSVMATTIETTTVTPKLTERATEIINDLKNHHGSESFFKMYPMFIITEGVKDMAEMCEAFWLLDAIFSHQPTVRVKSPGFQGWKLISKLTDDGELAGSADLVLVDAEGEHEVIQHMPFTDFPLPEISMFVCDNEHGGLTAMLPSEY
jgi:hypothetical protein